MTGTITIWTDGACSGNPGPGGWGAILRFAGADRELKGGAPDTTNNRMELMAAISALQSLDEPSDVDLHTDSQYVRGGITGWMAGWKRNGWRTADKKPVKEHGAVATARCRRAPSHDPLALGQGPRRPSGERARRCAGASGHGAVRETMTIDGRQARIEA